MTGWGRTRYYSQTMHQSDTPAVRLRLGPLFPRLVAAYIALPIVLACWVLPLTFSSAPVGGRRMAFVLGLAILLFLFLPRLGVFEVNIAAKTITVHEGLVASLLHFWRGRKKRVVELPPGSVVTIGEWLDNNAFSTLGVRIQPLKDGQTTLIEGKFAFDGPTAASLSAALAKIPGVSIRIVRLDETFQEVAWQPEQTTAAASYWPMPAVLSWSGLITAMLTRRLDLLLLVGLASVGAYVVLRLYFWRRSPIFGDRPVSRFWLGFELFQFSLMYIVGALLGDTLRNS